MLNDLFIFLIPLLSFRTDEDSACEIENGGCSDDCNTLGNSYYCDCPKQCWGLSTDERTCKRKMRIPGIIYFRIKIWRRVVVCPSTYTGFNVPDLANIGVFMTERILHQVPSSKFLPKLFVRPSILSLRTS